MIAITPKRASAKRPSSEHQDEEDGDDRVEEGEDVAGDDARDRARGGLGRRRRGHRAASWPRRSRGRWDVLARRSSAYSIGCGRMALKLGLNLGYWGIGPGRRGGGRGREGGRARRLRVGLGGRVLRLRRGQRPRLAGAADLDDQPRRRDPPGPGTASGGGGDGRGDDRQALGRPVHLRLRPVRPPGLRRLVRGALRQALGPDPRVHRGGPRDHRPRGPGRPPGRALPAAARRVARARR